MGRKVGFTEDQLRGAVSESLSVADVLRRLDMCPSGSSHGTIKKYCALWQVSTSHFLSPSQRARRQNAGDAGFGRAAVPLEELLAASDTVCNNTHLKNRLYKSGLKEPLCEECGQGEIWRGKRMALILGHVNGIRSDRRLKNLRVLCPNCNATLETHCRKKTVKREVERTDGRRSGKPRPWARKVERQPYAQILVEVASLGWRATGKKYGVSDNAIRKWVRSYEKDLAV